MVYRLECKPGNVYVLLLYVSIRIYCHAFHMCIFLRTCLRYSYSILRHCLKQAPHLRVETLINAMHPQITATLLMWH